MFEKVLGAITAFYFFALRGWGGGFGWLMFEELLGTLMALIFLL